MLGKIKAGIGTWAGIITGILLLLPPAANQIISYIENNSARFSGSEKLMAIVGLVPILVVIVGRMAQAVAAILKQPAEGKTGANTTSRLQLGTTPVGLDAGKFDKVREILTEHPEFVQKLREEGVIS